MVGDDQGRVPLRNELLHRCVSVVSSDCGNGQDDLFGASTMATD